MTEKIWLHVTLEYRTPAGNPGAWSGPLLTTWETCHDDALIAARRSGRKIDKVDSSSASAYQPGYLPSL